MLIFITILGIKKGNIPSQWGRLGINRGGIMRNKPNCIVAKQLVIVKKY